MLTVNQQRMYTLTWTTFNASGNIPPQYQVNCTIEANPGNPSTSTKDFSMEVNTTTLTGSLPGEVEGATFNCCVTTYTAGERENLTVCNTTIVPTGNLYACDLSQHL